MAYITSERRNRLLLWLALVLLVVLLLWASRRVLLPYLLGLVLAYLLLPWVNWLEHHLPARLRAWRIARALAIVVTYLILLAIVAGIMGFVVPLVIEQVNFLIDNWPALVERFEGWGREGLGWYRRVVPENWQTTIETNLEDLLGQVLTGIQNTVIATVTTLFGTVGFIIGLIVIPFWLFYILHDESQVKKGVVNVFPERIRPDIVAMARLTDDVLSAYIRGQLLLMLFVGGMATIAFLIIGVPFALVLGIIAGLFEILPYVGPILGALPAILVALLSNPITAVYVAVAFFAIQQVENLILVPRIAGQSVKLHPALVMVVLVIGNELAGFIGLVSAVPIAAIIRDIFKYLYWRMLDDPLTPAAAMSRVRAGKQVRLDV